MTRGKLTGIGLGPGDPELLTLRAARLIATARVVAYPAPAGGESFARSIAAGFIAPGTREIRVEVPMTAERAPAQAAYDRAAGEIAAVLNQGQDVVVLCEGDPFFYGSFMYLFSRLSGRFDCEVVPGVSSVSAASAALHLPLAARNETLAILPAGLPDEVLRSRIAGAECVAIIKLGSQLPRVRVLLQDMGLTGQAYYAERVSLPSQVLLPLSDAPDTAPYFSMILIVKGDDPWKS